MVLVFDEIKFRENLVFDKYSYYLLGFVNLGVTNALDDFKYQCKSENENNDTVATHILTFMERNILRS